jgi:hypothetical protein
MTISIAISIVALAISLSSFTLSLINFRRERKLKFLNKQTEILNKLTQAKFISARAQDAARKLSKAVSLNEEKYPRAPLAKEKLQILEEKLQRTAISIDKLSSDVEMEDADIDVSKLESNLQRANKAILVLEYVMNESLSLKEDVESYDADKQKPNNSFNRTRN